MDGCHLGRWRGPGKSRRLLLAVRVALWNGDLHDLLTFRTATFLASLFEGSLHGVTTFPAGKFDSSVGGQDSGKRTARLDVSIGDTGTTLGTCYFFISEGDGYF